MDTGHSDHAREFRELGYVVFRGFFSKEQAAELLGEVERCSALDAESSSLTGNGIRFTGGIFKRSEIARTMLADPRLIKLLEPISSGDLWVIMDQAVLKYPGAGDFRWHQDNGYNRLKCEQCQVWIALTESHQENGALTLAPGSHKRGLLPHTYHSFGQMSVDAKIGESITIDADAGDLIIFSSLILHCTGPNRADTERVAYVAEYLRFEDYAPASTPPFFVVAEGGKPNPHFSRKKPGARSIRNQLLYLRPRLTEMVKKPLRYVRYQLFRRD